MFANAKTNTYGWNSSGWHVFGNADMRDCWAPGYWYNYSGIWPSSGGVSAKLVSDIIIYSNQAPPPKITVGSPNGGESWVPGSNHAITWSSSGGVGSYVKMEVLRGSVVVQTLSSSTPNDGIFRLDYFDRTGNRDRLPDSDHEHYHSISYGHKQQQLCYRVWYCRHNHCDVPKWRRILGSGIQPCDYVVVIRWCGIICKDGGAQGICGCSDVIFQYTK